MSRQTIFVLMVGLACVIFASLVAQIAFLF